MCVEYALYTDGQFEEEQGVWRRGRKTEWKSISKRMLCAYSRVITRISLFNQVFCFSFQIYKHAFPFWCRCNVIVIYVLFLLLIPSFAYTFRNDCIDEEKTNQNGSVDSDIYLEYSTNSMQENSGYFYHLKFFFLLFCFRMHS